MIDDGAVTGSDWISRRPLKAPPPPGGETRLSVPKRHSGRFILWKIDMKAETQAVADEIEQSIELLRRHL